MGLGLLAALCVLGVLRGGQACKGRRVGGWPCTCSAIAVQWRQGRAASSACAASTLRPRLRLTRCRRSAALAAACPQPGIQAD